ncbi:hypothetical protein [uncultured Psychroserpens sp.]|uniref:hypothetical protein n=1 Tax=uncultured Psychroserpens sp. TaxID=255436 RepID=UPI00262A49BE|nr:hypothetical protein [uncultured Psychroserpens sp.]
MKVKLKTLILLLTLTFQSIILTGQEIQSVRYKVTSNSLLDMIKDYPEKKESIKNNIVSNTPKHVDFVLIDDELIQMYWSYQNDLIGIKIYSKEKIYSISAENELLTENQSAEIDSIRYKRIKTKNDSINKYELAEKGAMPLIVFLKDGLENDNFSRLIFFKGYPEISIVTDFKVFPEKYIFGKPKAFMTFDFLTNLNFEIFESKKEYLKFINDIDSNKERQLLIEKISK